MFDGIVRLTIPAIAILRFELLQKNILFVLEPAVSMCTSGKVKIKRILRHGGSTLSFYKL